MTLRAKGPTLEFSHSLGQKLTSAAIRDKSALPSIVLEKSFLGAQQNFLGPLMRFVRCVRTKRSRTIVSALQSAAVAAAPKNQLSRDFWYRSVFEFCNTIPSRADVP